MTRSMWTGDPLLLAGGTVLAAALLVMLGTRPAIPQEQAPPVAAPAAAPPVGAALTGPLRLCRLPAPPARRPVVVWQRGHELVVAAARLDDPLPEALHAHAPTGVWHVPLQPWLGFVPDGPHHERLRLPGGLELDCEPTAED